MTATAMLLGAAAPAPPATWRLTPDGLGPLHIRMTLAQAGATLGARITTRAPDGSESTACVEGEIDAYRGLYLLFEHGRLTRIDILADTGPPGRPARFDVTGNRTSDGLRLGSTEQDVRRVYGRRLKIATAPYLDEPAHELTVIDAGAGRGLVFETDVHGVVVDIRAGGKAIGYMEGCL